MSIHHRNSHKVDEQSTDGRAVCKKKRKRNLVNGRAMSYAILYKGFGQWIQKSRWRNNIQYHINDITRYIELKKYTRSDH